MKFIFWIAFWFGCALCQKDHFSSTESLKGLLDVEEKLVDLFKNVADRSLIIPLQQGYLDYMTDPEGYVGNPINAFLLLKRLVIDWKVVGSQLDKESNLRAPFKSIITSDDYPTTEDLSGAAQAFVRLQETYKLNPYDLSQGLIKDIQTSSKLSWEDCYYLSKILLGLKDHCHAQEWIKVALRNLLETPNKIQVLEKFIVITAGINDMDTTLEIANLILELDPKHNSAKVTKQMINQLPSNIREHARVRECKIPDTVVSTKTFEQYQAACRDEFQRSPAETRNLTCSYASFRNPFLKLAPFRLEVVSNDPYIVIFHNVLSDREIENFHNIGASELTRSRVGANDQQKKKSSIRTSHGAFLDYNTEPSLWSFLQRLQDLTGQTIKGSERIQFANYGIGGHYQPHFDFFGKDSVGYANYDQGDRISTSMFYLSDVELGGSTAFPFLRINVKPEKGSLLFWLNLHTSGEMDHRTLHAGCPVLLGSKYIVNVWHRLYPQMFYRKCGLEDDSWKSKYIQI